MAKKRPAQQLVSRIAQKSMRETQRALLRRAWSLERTPTHNWNAWQERIASAASARVLSRTSIDLAVDVGANTGQYGASLRSMGYTGPILSFEPQLHCLAPLRAAAANDGNWTVRPVAVGETDGELDLHVAGNSLSSSLLPMLDRHAEAAPESRYVAVERVAVRRLDDELAVEPWSRARNIWLKVDTQGYEWPVVLGAETTLQRTAVLEMELSFTPLYEGQRLFSELVAELEQRGFVPSSMHEVFVDPANGRLLQVDGLFVREEAAGRPGVGVRSADD